MQTANSDTPHSWVGMDLRAEPMVLTLPAIEKDRYYSVMQTDFYTQNFDYIGSRTTGNDGGVFVTAGPNWTGETPEGVTKVFQAETELALAVFRTQLFSPDDIAKVKEIQAGYKVETLPSFLGQPAPGASGSTAVVWRMSEMNKAILRHAWIVKARSTIDSMIAAPYIPTVGL